jgi:hypothetical protein
MTRKLSPAAILAVGFGAALLYLGASGLSGGAQSPVRRFERPADALPVKPKKPESPPDDDVAIDKVIERLSRATLDRRPPRDPLSQAVRIFRKLDRNRDGFLDLDEMPTALRGDWHHWDRNGDGLIDVQEYGGYFAARLRQVARERGVALPAAWLRVVPAPPEKPPVRPTVYRAGHLPAELPTWFNQSDTDHDGQVGLYEWKACGGNVEEFLRLDLNHDGFITAEEFLRAQRDKGHRSENSTRHVRN